MKGKNFGVITDVEKICRNYKIREICGIITESDQNLFVIELQRKLDIIKGKDNKNVMEERKNE